MHACSRCAACEHLHILVRAHVAHASVSQKNKESKNNEYSTAVNAHNEMVKADDDTDSKEKT